MPPRAIPAAPYPCIACRSARREVVDELMQLAGRLPPIQRAWFIEQWELTCETHGWADVSPPSPLPAPNCVHLPP